MASSSIYLRTRVKSDVFRISFKDSTSSCLSENVSTSDEKQSGVLNGMIRERINNINFLIWIVEILNFVSLLYFIIFILFFIIIFYYIYFILYFIFYYYILLYLLYCLVTRYGPRTSCQRKGHPRFGISVLPSSCIRDC